MNKKLMIGIAALIALLWGIAWYGFGAGNSPQAGVRQSEIVELKNGDTYTLTAGYVMKEIAGKEQRMLAYNGMIPGPEFHIPQDAEVTIEFKNNTDMPALLHSHGVRMDNRFDGSQLQQRAIEPGGSFTYKLKFPDAGAFWYHPHENEVYGQALGLYGAYIVEPQTDYYPPVNSERVVFLSDIPIANGGIAIKKDGKDHSLMGHFGNVMLVNGQESYSLSAKTGEVIQLDVINVANARPFNFAIAGARLKLVGGDGGAYEKASWRESVIVAPSERAIVDVMFSEAGEYEIRNQTPEGIYALGKISVSPGTAGPSYASQFSVLQDNKTVSESIDPFRSYFNKAPDKKLVLSVDFTGMMAGHMQGMEQMAGGHSMTSAPSDGIEWNDSEQMMRMMNNMSTVDETKWKITDAATGKSNMDIDWTFKKGRPIKIEIYNDPYSMHPMQHPIHFHGQRFLVVSRDGVAQSNLVWKDTVLVKTGERVEIVLDPSNPGAWMAHCHISEHLAAGMMFAFSVE